ncbi:CaiB/BaiF CoA transferase family protein [Sphingomonas immobilis]|uniref:CoA transferase n=1 Tax=Sphingomonas immobilis TaxID=3063997 RepID=A0ABT9A1B1_9SPHN|nr:CoA transferase [Sphingomonas sp. CA1-15]MDO7843626.1 CoA transferase [Sphingomonas sp. CA1-15]
MSRPLEGIKVVEVAMWAFVPSAGAVLADLGADVIKVEPPTGDPIRGLVTGGLGETNGLNFMFEIFNRGKRSITLDLKLEGALDVLHKLLADADVFLTNLLPAARRSMSIDVDAITARHPNLIYAVGSGQGAHGPDAEKGGYDNISFWARCGIASAVTPAGQPYPVGMPGGAFGDGLSGAIFAGGIAAAIAQRAMTGKASVVDASLLATGMWAMQPGIVGSSLAGLEEMPKPGRLVLPNPLVNTYRTSDGRFVSLCMLQGQRYWPGLCVAIGRPDLATDPRFEKEPDRVANISACVAVLDEVFATGTLSEWRDRLATQDGQWDVVQKVGELASDESALANRFIQDVDYGDGRSLKMVSVPVQFDREAVTPQRGPELGADSDGVLTSLGYSDDEILDLKIAGIVF